MSRALPRRKIDPKNPTPRRLSSFWTNRSVANLAQGGDPVETIVKAAREAVLDAMEAGWSGPPFDPFELASHMEIAVMPRDEVPNARLVPSKSGVRIEFNPGQPPARTRFSVAHELAHTLFPDHNEAIRNRGQPQGDDWQLELLCNVAAAEFLMPIGTAWDLEDEPIDVEHLVRLRNQFEVSTEAMFLRIAKLTRQRCAVFAAARASEESEEPEFRIDYTVPSLSWQISIPEGFKVTGPTALAECTAVGFTSKRREKWSESLPRFSVECVGIPAYPGSLYPRVIGILRPTRGGSGGRQGLTEVRGDATQPRGPGRKILAHVVNDKTPRRGAGFARLLGKKWPPVQNDFMRWAGEQRSNLTLGNTHVTQTSDELSVFHMVAQHGYGPSTRPRIRYAALSECLDQLAEHAVGQSATVHMPRIGTGYAGGQWNIVHELIDDALVRKGVGVTVYRLPDSINATEVQRVLRTK